jgi:hypothetical protein
MGALLRASDPNALVAESLNGGPSEPSRARRACKSPECFRGCALPRRCKLLLPLIRRLCPGGTPDNCPPDLSVGIDVRELKKPQRGERERRASHRFLASLKYELTNSVPTDRIGGLLSAALTGGEIA